MKKNKLLIWLLIIAFIKGLVWMMLTPIFQVPDENVHYGMIHYLAQNNQLPGFTNEKIVSQEQNQVGQIVRFNWMASHPVWQGYPDNWYEKIFSLDSSLKTQFGGFQKQVGQKLPKLYYWLNYPVYKLFQSANFFIRFYSLRFVSVLISLIVVFLSYKTSQLVLKSKALSIAVASFVAMQPTFSFIISSISYDVLAILVATLFLYFALLYQKTKKHQYLVACVALVVVGIFTKTQLIALALILPFLFPAFIILIVPFLFLKDYQESLIRLTSVVSTSNLFKQAFSYLQTNLKPQWAQVFPWYWGVFGWLEKTMPLWVYRILKILIGVSILGFFKSKKFPAKQLILLTGFSLSFVLVVLINDFLIFSKSGAIFGFQGRYLLPGITAHMILLVFGLKQLFDSKFLSKALILFSLGLQLVGLYSLYQYFGCVWCSLL